MLHRFSWMEKIHARFLETPFFRVRKEQGRVVTEGSPACALGHSSQSNPGSDADPFASWDWNGRRLTIRNDRYGFYPLFYYCRQGELTISPSMLKLLAVGAPTEIDSEALGVMLRLDLWLGEDTAFRAIRLVPPNAVMYWEDGRLEMSGGYLIGKEDAISRESAMDGYIDLFRAAIRRRPSEGLEVVPLSGGRDSRHIFLELCENGAAPSEAITVRYDPHIVTQDVEVAAKLAAEAGVRHVVVQELPTSVEGEWEKNIITQLSTLEHAWIAAIADYLNGKFATVYEGVGGDLLSTCFANTPERQLWLERGEFDRVAESLIPQSSYLDAAFLDRRLLIGRHLCLASRGAVRARLVAELQRHAEAANPLGSFLFWNRARRITSLAPHCILSRVAKVWCPYLDADLFDFLVTLPARMMLADEYHRFHTEVICRAFPRYAHIPFSSKHSERRSVRWQNRLLKGLASLALSRRKPELLDRAFVALRLLRGALDRNYSREFPELAKMCIYLLQLEEYNRQGALGISV